MKWLALLLVVAAGVGAAWWLGYLPQALPAAQPQAAAPVYQWKDAQGRVHYGDVPPADTRAKQADLPQLTVVEMPKASPPEKKQPAMLQPQFDADGNPVTTPSRQLRNPALERMGLSGEGAP